MQIGYKVDLKMISDVLKTNTMLTSLNLASVLTIKEMKLSSNEDNVIK